MCVRVSLRMIIVIFFYFDSFFQFLVFFFFKLNSWKRLDLARNQLCRTCKLQPLGITWYYQVTGKHGVYFGVGTLPYQPMNSFLYLPHQNWHMIFSEFSSAKLKLILFQPSLGYSVNCKVLSQRRFYFELDN